MFSVVSLQVGKIEPLGPEGIPSGFVKRAVSGSMLAGTLGLEGDQQADLKVHGGRDKAIYFYPLEHYPRWAAEVPRHKAMLNGGGFGENVTTMGLDEKSVAIGDVMEIGSSLMEVTQPRRPCFKLGLRFGDNVMGKIMINSGRSGWYVRVIQAGEIRAGDEIKIVRRANAKWTISRFNQMLRYQDATREDLMELSELPGLADRWRAQFAELLGEMKKGNS